MDGMKAGWMVVSLDTYLVEVLVAWLEISKVVKMVYNSVVRKVKKWAVL